MKYALIWIFFCGTSLVAAEMTDSSAVIKPAPPSADTRPSLHAFFLSADYFFTLSEVRSFLPSATGASAGYRFGLADLLNTGAPLPSEKWNIMPSVRIDFRYLGFGEKSYSERICSIVGGPEWIFRPSPQEPLYVTAGLMPGVSYVSVSSPTEIKQGTVWNWRVQSGFEYRFAHFGLFLNYSYSWFADTKSPLHGWGGALGLLYRL